MTNALEEYGIMPGKGSASLQHVERDYLPVQEFFDQASTILPAPDEVVKPEVVPELDQLEERWHPAAYIYAVQMSPWYA